MNKIRPFIKDFWERCLIAAVDTAVPFLRHAALNADFIVSADPQYWNMRHLDRAALPNGSGSAAVLIANPELQNAALRLFSRCFLFSSQFPLGRFFENAIGEKGALAAGGSVATSAFDFACFVQTKGTASEAGGGGGGGQKRIETKPLFIAGLDLAYSDFCSHFKGAFFEERALSGQSRFSPAEQAAFNAAHSAVPFWTESAGGGLVLSDKRLSLYAKWFENRLKGPAAANVSAIFPSGLVINGLKSAALSDLLSLPNIREKIEKQKEALFKEIDGEWNLPSLKTLREARFNAARTELCSALKNIKNGQEAELLKSSRIKEIIDFLLPKEAEAGSADYYKNRRLSAEFYLSSLIS